MKVLIEADAVHDDSYWNEQLNNAENYNDVLDAFFEETKGNFNGGIDVKLLQPYYSKLYGQLREYGFDYKTNPWLIFLVNYYVANRTFNFTADQYSLLDKQFEADNITEDDITGKTADGTNGIYYNPSLYKEESLQNTNYKILTYSWFKSAYSVQTWCNNYTLLAAVSDSINLNEYNRYLQQGRYAMANQLVKKEVKVTPELAKKLMTLCFTQDITRVVNSQYIRNRAQRDSHIIQVYEVKHIDVRPMDRNTPILDATMIQQNVNIMHVSEASSDATTDKLTDETAKSNNINELITMIKQSSKVYSPYEFLYVLGRTLGKESPLTVLNGLENFDKDSYATASQMNDERYYKIKELINKFDFDRQTVNNALKAIVELGV